MFRKVFFFIVLFFCFCLLVAIYRYYYIHWSHFWHRCSSIPAYRIKCHNDDTLRILLIGDSWAEMHSELQMDTFLCSRMRKEVMCPVSVMSKGKGGEKCREIYQLMYESGGHGTKSLFESGTNYCIIFAGINDAATNRGTKQFCYHYKLILDFLFQNKICPVVIEIPDVDIWNVYKNKPFKDILIDFIRSTMTHCKMYEYHDYREALYEMLLNEKLLDRVVYVPMDKWNGNGEMLNSLIFMEDKIHLNREGYQKLDESIAEAIANNLKQSKDSTLVNNHMHHNTYE